MTPREIDALVAEKVMGLTVKPIKTVSHKGVLDDIGTVSEPYKMRDGREGVSAKSIPHYSSDIAAAWLVLQRFEHIELTRDYGRWACELCCEVGAHAGIVTPGFVEHEEMAMAVCLAALKYKGIEVGL